MGTNKTGKRGPYKTAKRQLVVVRDELTEAALENQLLTDVGMKLHAQNRALKDELTKAYIYIGFNTLKEAVVNGSNTRAKQ